MTSPIRRSVAVLLSTVLSAPLIAAAVPAAAAPEPLPAAQAAEDPPPEDTAEDPRLLVFSKTGAFRHGSIPVGVAAVEDIGAEHGYAVDVYDPDLEQSLETSPFNDEDLAQYDAVVWMSTTGDVLDAEEKEAFERYIEGGGGYAGVHAASDTEYSWAWYGGLVGAYFSGHPDQQDATVTVTDRVHPSTSHLPTSWERFDEWYNFRTNPRGDVHVLATLDEETFDPGSGAMGRDHPIAWCQYYNGGRSWYTGLGHTDESYAEPNFREHLTGGVLWAAGELENDCGGTKWSNYQKVVLDNDTGSPMGLDVAPDGRVFYIERAGQVKIIDPETSTTSTAGTIPVHTEQENGLLGIVLDPDFADNGWVYLYYSPTNDAIDSPQQHLSRFTLTGDTLDLASEQILLEVPHQRDTCCHSGGYLQFGPDGNLWVSTGDDTSPSASDGFTPIDEREGREAYDAQRSSANTNDLRGKLLRITPTDDGGYTIPEGNLFDEAEDTEDLTLPEIYAMGFRNPFRFAVDQETGWAYLGDYGPDANAADPERGSDGRVEWNLIKEPGNYGWPYCHGGAPFNDYDFATGTPGEPFDCDNLVNDSPNNTGLTELPPNVEPTVWYGRDVGHPDIGTGGAPMGGPRYYFDETIDSERQWPQYFDGTVLFYEWGQNDLYEFHLDEDGELYDITPLLSDISLNRPHELTFGAHDGALYAIEWGSGFGGNNPDSQIVRIDYTGGNADPIARAAATPVSGSVPLEVEFSSAGTAHPQGGELEYLWTFGDGATSTEPNPTHTYTAEGNYTAVLTVSDVQGRTGTANVRISAGNTAPTVTVTWPVEGGVFTYDDEIAYEVTVTDPEDGSTEDGGIDCSDITVQVILGHDDHGHPGDQFTGCSGTFVAERDDGHTDVDRITYVLEATYTDRGSPDGTVAPMTGRGLATLQPSRKQAEHHDPQDIRNEETRDPMGGNLNIGWITDGDYASYSDFNFVNIDSIQFRVAASNDTSRIEVRKDAPDGELLGTAEVPNTGGFQNWDWAEAEVTDPGETFDLYLVFRGGDGYLLNLNFFDFIGQGVAVDPEPEPVVVTPAAVEFVDVDGTEDDVYVVPEVEGVAYLVDGEVVAAGSHPGVGTVTVTAEALDGFELAEGATTEWSHTFSDEGGEPEPVVVTPAAVEFVDEDGTEDDVYVVPEVEGVAYLVDGEVVAAGSHPGVGTVTVTAEALDGFELAEGATAEWSHTFSDDDGEEPGEPEPPRSPEFHLSNDWLATTHHAFRYGRVGDDVFIGDWNGDGRDTIAVRRGNVFHVSNALRGGEADQYFSYGRPGDVVLVGDWDGDGRDTFAVRRGSQYHVKNSLIGGQADLVVNYGRSDDDVLVGDWDGDGRDTFTVRRGAQYHVKDVIAGGPADRVFWYGRADDAVLAGDWDGDGRDTFAVRREATYHVKNSLSGGDADIRVRFGRADDEVLVGDWDGDGRDTLGVRRGGTAATGLTGTPADGAGIA